MAKGSGGGGRGFRQYRAAYTERTQALNQMTELRNSKPSARARAIGSRPSPEVVARYENRVKEWNRAYSAAQRRFKKFDKISGDLYRPEFASRF